MKKSICLLLLIFVSNLIYSQENKDSISIYGIIEFVELDAEFPGGSKEMYKWISDHYIYPEGLSDETIEGKVYVSFIVETDGSLSNIEIVKGVNKHLDKECIRLVNSMPKWKPAYINEQKVRSRYTLPFQFD